MTIEQFWEIINRVNLASNGDMDEKCDLLATELRQLHVSEVQSFYKLFHGCMDRAYTWELWGAAYLIGGGCGDDSFMDFRSTLISMGRDVFERAVTSPDSLAELDIVEDVAFFEGFLYVPAEVYEELTEEQPQNENPRPDTPAGEEWDEDGLAVRLPKLAAKYNVE